MEVPKITTQSITDPLLFSSSSANRILWHSFSYKLKDTHIKEQKSRFLLSDDDAILWKGALSLFIKEKREYLYTLSKNKSYYYSNRAKAEKRYYLTIKKILDDFNFGVFLELESDLKKGIGFMKDENIENDVLWDYNLLPEN